LNFYCYYRVTTGADEWRARVRAMQKDLLERRGIRGELFIKHEDPATWMEVYYGIEEARVFEECLAELVKEHRLEESLLGGTTRHIERFEPV
jgi:hypothetical protein